MVLLFVLVGSYVSLRLLNVVLMCLCLLLILMMSMLLLCS